MTHRFVFHIAFLSLTVYIKRLAAFKFSAESKKLKFLVYGIMGVVSWKEVKIVLCFFVFGTVHSFKYPEETFEENGVTWPTKMSFQETKTNALFGDVLLKRLYTRIDHTENVFRMELSQIYDRLKNEIEKKFRKCDRKRRRAESMKPQNLTSPNGQNKNKHQKRDKKRTRKDKKPLIDERVFYQHD